MSFPTAAIIALVVLILFCLIFLLVFIELGVRGLSVFFGFGKAAGAELVRKWKKADELQLNYSSRLISHDPKLEVLRTKSFFQGEFKGRLPFLKFFKKEIRAYIVYPVEVRYYVPLQNKLEFVKLDDNLYGGLDAVGVNVADVEAEISEPGFAGSKLFIDIDSSKISVDEKQLILKKCWDAISRGLDEKGLPEGIEHNKIAARNLAAKAVEDILRGLDIVQPVEVRFIEKITGREVDSSWQNKFLEPFEKIFSLSQNDIK